MLIVNGKEFEIENEISLELLLQQLALSDTPCAVEVNKDLIPHRQRKSCKVYDGDTIEIVTLVGGG